MADALARVGDRWTLLIVAPPRRPEALQRARGRARRHRAEYPHARLKTLTEEALVVAQAYSERPPRFLYELSESGRELAGALRLLADWGARSGGGEPYRHETCGTALEARWWCPSCEQIVDDPDDDELVHV